MIWAGAIWFICMPKGLSAHSWELVVYSPASPAEFGLFSDLPSLLRTVPASVIFDLVKSKHLMDILSSVTDGCTCVCGCVHPSLPKMAGTGLAKSMTHEIKLSWYDWLASLLLSCEALDELLNLSEPLFPPLKTGMIIVSTSENCCMVSLRTYRKHLAQSRCWADSCIILV